MRPYERRAVEQDRRRRATPVFSGHLLTGRRRSARREKDQSNGYYTDIPAGKALLAAAVLLTLCALDAALSLHLFDIHKAEEANPLLALALGWGELSFLAVKFGLTIACLLIICAHWNFNIFRRVRMATLSHGLTGLYLGLVIYEITLLFR